MHIFDINLETFYYKFIFVDGFWTRQFSSKKVLRRVFASRTFFIVEVRVTDLNQSYLNDCLYKFSEMDYSLEMLRELVW